MTHRGVVQVAASCQPLHLLYIRRILGARRTFSMWKDKRRYFRGSLISNRYIHSCPYPREPGECQGEGERGIGSTGRACTAPARAGDIPVFLPASVFPYMLRSSTGDDDIVVVMRNTPHYPYLFFFLPLKLKGKVKKGLEAASQTEIWFPCLFLVPPAWMPKLHHTIKGSSFFRLTRHSLFCNEE